MSGKTRTAGVHILDALYPLDKEYTYYIPPTSPMTASVGDFVLVPFGGGNKKLTALVTSLSETEDYSKLKPIASPINASLSLNEEMMALVRFLCDRTLCTVGDAVRRLIPASAFERADDYYSIVNTENAPEDNALLSYLAEHSPASLSRLQEEFGSTVRRELRTLCEQGLVTMDTRIREAVGRSEKLAELIFEGDFSSLDRPRTPAAYREIVDALRENGKTPIKALTERGFKSAHIKALEKRGLLRITERETLLNHYRDIPVTGEKLTLSEEQQGAYNSLAALMDENAPKAALLYGVTGSGKTGVILSLCEKAIGAGKSAMVLVPEIALTRQTVAVFVSRFGERTAVIHSGLSDGERFDAYKRIRRGEVDLVLGTRSAVFAPLQNIGLIAMDEEQEYTYKSDMSPKYHARDIAKHRVTAHNALLLLASATPSVESFYEAQRGKYTLVKLTKRYHGHALPRVKLSDMRLATHTGDGFIGAELRALLTETFEKGKQSMLFLNRRGYHSVLTCRACGETLLCPNCSVSLTHHKTRFGSRLVCHYCGYSISVPRFCKKCGSEHLSFGGYGTQLIEEEIASFLPNARILRMDADTTKERFSQDAITAAFGRGEADILVGTQMIAKGHNFPMLSLVGVLAADASLFLDDYRAGERTFSLITQVIGRAGRNDGDGIALIQTFNPENETIRRAAAQNYDAFYQNEIATRRALVFPPFCDIAVFGFSGEEEAPLRAFAAEFAKALGEKQKADFPDVLYTPFGPFEAPVFKVKNRYRMRLVLKFKNNKRARSLFAAMLSEYGKGSKVSLFVDINPTST